MALITISKNVNAQNSEKQTINPFAIINKEKLFKPYFAIETWATYSTGEEKGGVEYDDRADITFRRFRFGGSGNPISWLKYSFQFNADRLGQDSYSSIKGSYGGVSIWNAYITAKLLKNSQLLNLHAGYFWAAISREFNTSPWAVASYDKTRSAWFLRSFVTGKGNGIESGIGLGGIKNFNNFGISYRIGTYETAKYANKENASRLYTGRFMFSFGDPEQTKYKYMLSGNSWKKRKGVTIGFGGSTQSDGYLSENTYFDKSTAYGGDIAFDYSGIRIDAEYFKMKRTMDGVDDFDGTEYHLRLAYNFIAGNKYLEPTITYDKFEGEGNSSLFNHIGDDYTYDVGINWYVSKSNLKLSLHYVIQDGSASARVGDYLGVACQFKL